MGASTAVPFAPTLLAGNALDHCCHRDDKKQQPQQQHRQSHCSLLFFPPSQMTSLLPFSMSASFVSSCSSTSFSSSSHSTHHAASNLPTTTSQPRHQNLLLHASPNSCLKNHRLLLRPLQSKFVHQHMAAVLLLLLLTMATGGLAQFNSQTYPDPRIDPFTCRLILPGQVCDPSEIFTPEERRLLNEKIMRLQQITVNIKNSSPACNDATRNSNLYIIIALIEKLGTLPFDTKGDSVSIEKFTNQLRSKYLNYQDVALCDPLVLIVNSRSDRQVFTVAGRDAKLSREVLQAAFQRNLGHFRTGNYAMGLEGMVELIVSAYGGAHIVQTPTGDVSLPSSAASASSTVLPVHLPSVGSSLSTSSSSSSSGTQFVVAQGVRQRQQQEKLQRVDLESSGVPEEDRLWARILLKALAQCGDDPNRLTKYTRAIVEDAMEISLKLISDTHYNKIEEDAQNAEKQPNARDKAWMELKPYLESLYHKHFSVQFPAPNSIDQCPVPIKGGPMEEQQQQQQQKKKQRWLRIVRLT